MSKSSGVFIANTKKQIWVFEAIMCGCLDGNQGLHPNSNSVHGFSGEVKIGQLVLEKENRCIKNGQNAILCLHPNSVFKFNVIVKILTIFP